jgi:transcriptional regulator with XRE-family HTH domain
MSKASIGRKAATAVDIYVGQKMRARRIFLRLTQTDLSEALGITFQQFQKYENGAKRVGATRLQKISEALGVSPIYFFEGAPTVEKKTPAPKKVFVSKAPIGRRAASAVDIHVGRKIRARRLFLGMSQTDLGETLGIRFTQIQKYETGAQRPAPARLQKISEALGVSPFYFFEGAPTVRKTTPAPEKESISTEPVGREAGNAVDAHVGRKIRARRMVMGMSQTELGDALGITLQQVQKYEKGAERVGASRLQKISVALDVAVFYFFEGSPTAGK